MSYDKAGINEVNAWANSVGDILDKVHKNRMATIAIYPKVSDDDARLTALAKLANNLRPTYLALKLISKSLHTQEWWEKNTIGGIPDERYRIDEILQYLRFIKIGFLQTLFMTVESSFRLFLERIDLTSYNKDEKFHSIYNFLFSRLANQPFEGIELLKLLSHFRNTVHNNGIFLPHNKKNKSVTWRGTTYDFKHGTPVELPWNLLIEFAEAIRVLLLNVIKDDTLKNIQNEITDPYCKGLTKPSIYIQNLAP